MSAAHSKLPPCCHLAVNHGQAAASGGASFSRTRQSHILPMARDRSFSNSAIQQRSCAECKENQFDTIPTAARVFFVYRTAEHTWLVSTSRTAHCSVPSQTQAASNTGAECVRAQLHCRDGAKIVEVVLTVVVVVKVAVAVGVRGVEGQSEWQ